ncbi:MAG: TolC family outer membrane protein [Magnetococcales bacterium]|nr:TolC family outer membrane protein [Magnetococcales bacterium]
MVKTATNKATLHRGVLALLAGCLLCGQPSAAWSLTLREAAEQAVRSYPDVEAAAEYGKSLEQRVQQSLAGYLPRMDFIAAYGPEKTDNLSTRSANKAAGSTQHDLTLERGEAGLVVKQPLFDGFDTQARVAQAKALLQAAQAKLTLTADAVALSAVQAYIDLVTKHIQLELIKDNVLLHQRILAKVQTKFEGGAGNHADVDQAKSRTFLSSANHASSQATYKNTQAKFSEIIGLPPLQEPEMVRPQVAETLLPASVEEAFQRALAGSAEVEGARLAVLAAEAGVEVSKSGLWPRLDLELSATDSVNVGGNEGPSQSMAALLRMNFNLFAGGSDLSKVQEQRNIVAQARKNWDKSQRTLEDNIQESWNKLQMARDRLHFMRQHHQVSQRVTRSYHEQFKMGKRSLLDLLNSENELFAAKNGLLLEELAVVKSIYELYARMGILRDALEAEPTPQEGIRIERSPQESSPDALEVAAAAEGSSSTGTAENSTARNEAVAGDATEAPPLQKGGGTGPIHQPATPPTVPTQAVERAQSVSAGMPERDAEDGKVWEIRVVSQVAGNTLFFPEETKTLTDPLLGRSVSNGELLTLREKLTLLYVSRGYTAADPIQVERFAKRGIVLLRIPAFRASTFLDMSGQGVPSP